MCACGPRCTFGYISMHIVKMCKFVASCHCAVLNSSCACRVLRPQRRPAKTTTTAKTVKRAAAAQYRPKAGVRAATAAALSAAEDNLPRQTFYSRATRVFGCHQWKGLALGATAEDVPFSSGRFLARPSTGALPSGEQYAASLERFAGGTAQPEWHAPSTMQCAFLFTLCMCSSRHWPCVFSQLHVRHCGECQILGRMLVVKVSGYICRISW